MSGNEEDPTTLATLANVEPQVEGRAKNPGLPFVSTGKPATGNSRAIASRRGFPSAGAGVAGTIPRYLTTTNYPYAPNANVRKVKDVLIREGDTNFVLNKDVGQGSFGRIESAVFKNAHLRIAIKYPTAPRREDNYKRDQDVLSKEYWMLTYFQGKPNVVQVVAYDDGRQNGPLVPRIYMENVEGGTLEAKMTAWAKDKSGPDFTRFLDIATDIARGMVGVHKINIIFRGLKPAKLLIDAKNKVKIAGFGNAKYEGAVPPGAPPPQNFFTSTPQYLAPELTFNNDGSAAYPHDCGKGVDIYAYGVILFELASRKFAYEAPAPNTSSVAGQSNPINTSNVASPSNPINTSNVAGPSNPSKTTIATGTSNPINTSSNAASSSSVNTEIVAAPSKPINTKIVAASSNPINTSNNAASSNPINTSNNPAPSNPTQTLHAAIKANLDNRLLVDKDFFGKDVCQLITDCVSAQPQGRPSFEIILKRLRIIRIKSAPVRHGRKLLRVLPARLQPKALRESTR